MRELEFEVGKFGEPANPALSIMIREVFMVLNTGGAVVGFRGSGKSLLAGLAAVAGAAAWRASAVIDVGRLLQANGRVELAELAPSCGELAQLAEGPLGEWARARLRLGEARGPRRMDCSMWVYVEGAGLAEKLRSVARQLARADVVPILDGFEPVVANPAQYGYTIPRLREELYEVVARPAMLVGLALPIELWLAFDVHLKSYIVPVHAIRYTPQQMSDFLKRLSGRDPGALASVKFRNPVAVVNVARELAQKSPEAVIESRLEDLRRLAQAVMPRRADALYSALRELWVEQSAYAALPRAEGEAKKVLQKTPRGYELPGHVADAIAQYVYSREELRHLAYELQLLMPLASGQKDS